MKNLNANEAIAIVIAQLNLDNSARCTGIELSNDLYNIRIRTLVMKYEAYVDAATGEILGLDYEPDVDEAAAYEDNLYLVA